MVRSRPEAYEPAAIGIRSFTPSCVTGTKLPLLVQFRTTYGRPSDTVYVFEEVSKVPYPAMFPAGFSTLIDDRLALPFTVTSNRESALEKKNIPPVFSEYEA